MTWPPAETPAAETPAAETLASDAPADDHSGSDGEATGASASNEAAGDSGNGSSPVGRTEHVEVEVAPIRENDIRQERGFQHLISRLAEWPLIRTIVDRLHSDLPKNLRYHAPSHTVDVFNEALFFGYADRLSNRELELLGVAAAYHDAGFLEAPTRNEPIAADMADKALNEAGTFSQDERALIRQMILDTQLIVTESGIAQQPTTRLSRYLLDADLSNLGRKDFFEKLELQREETGQDRSLFLKRTLEFLNNHRWHTYVAARFREPQKEQNIAQLRSLADAAQLQHLQVSEEGLTIEQLHFLIRLPLLLNSSLNTDRVLSVSLSHLRAQLHAEAATVFLREEKSDELTFWILEGPQRNSLKAGKKMPSRRGIVGWVIEHQEPALVADALSDPRFFKVVDTETGFQTRDVLCVPLTARGTHRLGAVQILNSLNQGGFTRCDLHFLEQFAVQIALAIDNARLYDTLRDRSKKLSLLEKRKNEMISVIGHEFRTPLNVIRTAAELLTSGSLPAADAQRMSQTLQDGVSRLSRLVSEVRNIGLVSNEKLKIERQPTIVRRLIEPLEDQFRIPLSTRQLDFTTKVAPEAADIVLDVDPNLMSMVLHNLLSNAIRFTPDGGRVSVYAELLTELVEFSVEDTGIGIEIEHLPAIFEKFYEVGSALAHSSGTFEFRSAGLGLGLATAQAILRAHGSNIEVTSRPGQGSKFVFRIPVRNIKT